MAKYTNEFKLIVDKDYFKGPLGYKLLAKKQVFINIAKLHKKSG